jgi:hypothetical protein
MYLLIAYRTESYGRCGHIDATADLQYFNHLSDEELEDRIIQFRNNYDLVIFENGIKVLDEIEGYDWDGYLRGNAYENNSQELFDFEEKDSQERQIATGKINKIFENVNEKLQKRKSK